MSDRFWISTGDISEPYDAVEIVFGYGASDTAFGNANNRGAMRFAIDAMAIQAQGLGCNGVIWIRFDRIVETVTSFRVWAAGTAVRVTPRGGA